MHDRTPSVPIPVIAIGSINCSRDKFMSNQRTFEIDGHMKDSVELTCNILCQSWDLRPVNSLPSLVNAPFNECMVPVGVRMVPIVFLTIPFSALVKIHGALGISPSSDIQHPLFTPVSSKSLRALTLSIAPVRCFHIATPTFLKTCMGSNKWLMRSSFQ